MNARGKTATSSFCLDLAHARLSAKLSVLKSSHCSPSPTLIGLWDQKDREIREMQSSLKLWDSVLTSGACSEHQTKSSCVHQMEAVHGRPVDTHHCKHILVKQDSESKHPFENVSFKTLSSECIFPYGVH